MSVEGSTGLLILQEKVDDRKARNSQEEEGQEHFVETKGLK